MEPDLKIYHEKLNDSLELVYRHQKFHFLCRHHHQKRTQ